MAGPIVDKKFNLPGGIPITPGKKSSPFIRGIVAGSIASLLFGSGAVYLYYRDEIRNRYKERRALEILKYGFPQRPPQIMYYTNHVLAYDSGRKCPLWVAEHLTKKSIDGPATRKRARFRPDPKLEALFSASNDDYWNSGWSRGHMAPAGNNKHDQSAMNETFMLTNVVPQDIENNSGFWNRLEIYCRELSNKYNDIRIISGPLFLPQIIDNKKFIKYEVIGDSNVAVPTHLFKIIVAENPSDSNKVVGAFVIPNAPISYEQKLSDFKVPIKNIEKEVGIKFFSKLHRYNQLDLCEVDGCKLLNRIEFHKYYLSRKLENTNTLKRLERVWKEIEQHGLVADAQLTKIYDGKKKLLGDFPGQNSENLVLNN